MSTDVMTNTKSKFTVRTLAPDWYAVCNRNRTDAI